MIEHDLFAEYFIQRGGGGHGINTGVTAQSLLPQENPFENHASLTK